MKLRPYKFEDGKYICSWIKSEEELYKWSADRFNKFPLYAEDIEASYAPQLATGHFYPLTAIDKNENVVGHFIIRFPDPEDLTIVRFGFVIVAPEIRGKGYGQEMLRLGIQYAKNELKAKRVCLGVFENNESARKCYEAVGFTKCSEEKYEMANAIWNCIEMELF